MYSGDILYIDRAFCLKTRHELLVYRENPLERANVVKSKRFIKIAHIQNLHLQMQNETDIK